MIFSLYTVNTANIVFEMNIYKKGCVETSVDMDVLGKENLWPLSGTEPQSLGRPARNLATVPNMLSHPMF